MLDFEVLNGEVLADIAGARVKAVAGNTRMLGDDDHGFLLMFESACTLTIPAGLRPDLSCGWLQVGTGQVTFAAGAGAVIREPDGLMATNKRWASGGLASLGGNAFLLFGRLGG